MKDKRKKITAWLMVAIMVISIAINSDVMLNYASGETPDVTLDVTLDAAGSNTTNGFWVVPSNSDDFYTCDSWQDKPEAITGGVYVDGTLYPGCVIIKFSWGVYYIAVSDGGITAKEGTKVVLDGIYGRGTTDPKVSQDNYTVKFNKATFLYTGGAWKQIYETEENPDVTADIEVDTTLSDGTSAEYIWVTSSKEDKFVIKDDWSVVPKAITGGVYVDGTLNPKCEIVKFSWAYFINVKNGGVPVKEGTTVVLDGIYGRCESDPDYRDNYTVKFNKATFEYTKNGWKQIYETDIVPSINVDSNLKDGNSGPSSIWIETTKVDDFYRDTTTDTEWSARPTRIAGGVYVDGTLNTKCALIKFDGWYYISLSDGEVSVKEGTTVVFDGIYGRQSGIDSAYSDGYAVKFNKATFQYTNGAWVQIFTADASVNPDGGQGTVGPQIYTNIADPLEANWDKSKSYSACSGGIYIDGVLDSESTLIKCETGDNWSEYIINTNGKGVKDGIRVVIDGVFGTTTQRIKVNKATFVYNGTTAKWKQVTNGDIEATGKDGDANADGSADVIDLVRMLRYTESNTDAINLTDADLNEDSNVDEKDIQMKKEILLGKTTFKNGYNITGKPQYEGTESLTIGAYCGPRRGTETYQTDWRTDERFAEYAEAGFNMVVSELDAVYGKNYDASGTESVAKSFAGSDLDKYMNLANKYGIDVIVESQILNGVLRGTKTLENADAELTTMLSALQDKPNFKGLMMSDEPNTSYLSNYRTVSEYFNTKSAMQGKTLFTSLLPYYADVTAFDKVQGGPDKTGLYMNYLREFGSCLGSVNCDFYPFEQNDSGQDSMRSAYLKNLEMTAVAALETGKESGVTIQNFASCNNVTGIYPARKLDKKAYYTYQLYASLAYGMKNITYFSYWNHYNATIGTETYSNSMINSDGTRNESVYNFVKEANTEIRGFEKVYMDFNWQGTMKVKGDDKNGLLAAMSDYTNPHIASVTATRDTIIGCLKDSNGYDGFMLVNVTDPSDNLSSQVTVTFQDAQKAIVYVEGVKKEVTLNNGAYAVTLTPGAGVFVIPYSDAEESTEVTVNATVKVDSNLIGGDATCITMWTAPVDELAYTSDWVDRPERLSGGVYVDGILYTNCPLIKFRDYYYIALSDIKTLTVQEGTTVVLNGIYGRQDGVDSAYGDGYTVEFNRAVFVYRSGSWVQCFN